jgi:hypothetical protein
MKRLLAVLTMIALPLAAPAFALSLDLTGQVRPYAGQPGPPCTYLCAGLLSGGRIDWLRIKSPDMPAAVIISRASAADCMALSPLMPQGQECWVVGPDRSEAADLALTFTDRDDVWDIALTDADGNTRMQLTSADYPGATLQDIVALPEDDNRGLAQVMALHAATGFDTDLDFPNRSRMRAADHDCPTSHPDYATLALSALHIWPLDKAPPAVVSMVDLWARDVAGCTMGDAASDAIFLQLTAVPRARHLPGLRKLIKMRPAIFSPTMADALEAVRMAGPDQAPNMAESLGDLLLRASSQERAAMAPAYRTVLDTVPDLPARFLLPMGQFGFDPGPYMTTLFPSADQPMAAALFQAACLADPQWNQSLTPVVHAALQAVVRDPGFSQGSHHEYDPDLQMGFAALRRMGALGEAKTVLDALPELGPSFTPQTLAHDLTDPLPKGGACALRR